MKLYARLAEKGSAKTTESIDSNLNIAGKLIQQTLKTIGEKRGARERDSYPKFMAQLIEDFARASSEIKRSPVRDAVKVIGRIISRKFLARELFLHGRARVKSKTVIRSAIIATALGVDLHASAVMNQPLARLARACLCNHPASSATTKT